MKASCSAVMFILMITVLNWAPAEAEDATFSFDTGILDVPRVVTNSGDYATQFQMGIDSKFSLTDVRKIQSYNIGDQTMNGEYDGVRNESGVFNTDSTDTTIDISSSEISVILDSFFGGECRLFGAIADDNSLASGTYQCADFTSGTWSSRHIKVESKILTAIIDFIPDGGSSFSSRVVGIKF